MNIDDMPAGPEMDRLVAEKVMGWERESRDDWGVGAYYTWGGRLISPIDTGGPAKFEPHPFFNPSTDIAHAWEVVERLPGMHLSHHPKGDAAWIAEIGMGGGRADTAPLAICRAALKALQ